MKKKLVIFTHCLTKVKVVLDKKNLNGKKLIVMYKGRNLQNEENQQNIALNK